MKLHKGTIYPTGEQPPKGEIEKRIKVFGKITPIVPTVVGDIQIKRINKLNGKAYNRTKTFVGSIKALDVRYIFFAAVAKLFLPHKADMFAAKANDIETWHGEAFDIGSNLQAGNSSKLTSKTKVLQAGVFSRLVAYVRAGHTSIRSLTMGKAANMMKSKGVVGRYVYEKPFEQTSDFESAESSLVKSKYNLCACEIMSDGCSAPPNIAAAESKFKEKATADAYTVKPTDVSILATPKEAQHSAKLSAWYAYEQDGDSLSMTQVFSGVQSGDVLEIDLEAENVYWANAYITDGILNLSFVNTAAQNDDGLELI